MGSKNICGAAGCQSSFPQRLLLNQTDFGKLGGSSAQTQMRYETAQQTPKLDYLSAIAEHGVDIGYIVTGTRSDGVADPMQQQLIDLFEKLPIDAKSTIFDLLSHMTGSYVDVTITDRENQPSLHSPSVTYRGKPSNE